MRILSPDLLVLSNPVWEETRLVEALPETGTASSEPLGGRDGGGEDRVVDGGGSALNTACALARAGRRVLVYGRAGGDEMAEAATAALVRHGIDARVERVPGRITRSLRIHVQRGTGVTAFEPILPPRTVPPWERIPAEAADALRSARILLLDRLTPSSRDWLSARRGLPLWNALTVNGPFGTERAAARLREVLPFIDSMQIPESVRAAEGPGKAPGPDTPRAGSIGADPASASAGSVGIHRPSAFPQLSEELVEEILRAGVRVLVRTRGAEGIVLHEPGSAPVVMPALPARVLDPTGAGDAFSAGLLEGILRGLSMEESARIGLDWAARACRYLGARGWIDAEPPEREFERRDEQ